MSGLLTASNASGQLVFLPILAWIASDLQLALDGRAVVVVAVGDRDPARAHLPAPARRPRSASCPTGRPSPRRRSPPRPEPVPQRHLDAARVRAQAGLPAARVRILRVRRDDERPDRDAPDRRLRRPRLHRGAGRRAARGDRRVRHRRHDHIGLADRSLRPALAAVLVLRPARHLAARAECGAQLGRRRPGRVRDLRRSRLGRHRAADDRAVPQDRRARARRRRLRLGLLLAPARRGLRRLGRGLHALVARHATSPRS